MRKTMKSILMLAAVSIAVVLCAGCSKSQKEKIIMKGSTTVLPIAQKTAEAFMDQNKISISVSGSGSGDGIKSIIEGHCDIANSSRAIKKKEEAKAQEKGVNLREIAVAYDMIVPVVHPENAIQNITLDQLKGVYDGSITNWSQLGGADKPIVVVSRDTSSGTYEVWHKLVMKKTQVRPDSLLQASNGAVVGVVSQNPNAIGYVGFGYINSSIKPVNVNDIVPTIENGKSGTYEISRKLYMYVNNDTISKSTEAYINFVLSDEGQGLVKEAGFISM